MRLDTCFSFWCLKSIMVNQICNVFVCLSFFIPLKNFSLIWIRLHYRWRAIRHSYCFEPYYRSTLMAIEQWRFFSMLHLHGISVIWSSPRTRDTHTYWWAFSSGAVNTCFDNLLIGLLQAGYKNPTFRMRGQRFKQLCNRPTYEICVHKMKIM